MKGTGYGAAMHEGGAGSTPELAHREGSDQSGGPRGFDTDLLVTGAGMAAAIRGAELGARVTIVERGTVGGTCVNVGCIPSKNLIAAAEHVHQARRGFPGIAAVEPEVDWSAVLGQKNRLVERLRQAKYLDVLAAYPQITLLRGQAQFGDNGTVEVNGRRLRARGVVVATGTSSWAPPIPGLDEAGYLDLRRVGDCRRAPPPPSSAETDASPSRSIGTARSSGWRLKRSSWPPGAGRTSRA